MYDSKTIQFKLQPKIVLYNTLSLDPERDLKSAGYTLGKFNVGYFFYRNLFLSSNTTRFYIKEISRDRTE
jgi:hypothetical protein